jgi:amino acid transporter
MEGSTQARLARGLQRWDVVALVINSIIGAGIYGLPSRVFALAGTYSLLAYVVSTVPIVLIILCFAEVGSRFKATGGPYLYAHVAFGSLMGFQVGWLMWLSRIAAFAALCNLFIGYLGYFVAAASDDAWRAFVATPGSCLPWGRTDRSLTLLFRHTHAFIRLSLRSFSPRWSRSASPCSARSFQRSRSAWPSG